MGSLAKHQVQHFSVGTTARKYAAMSTSIAVSGVKVHADSSLSTVDSDVVTGHNEEIEKREHKAWDDNRVRLCSTVIVAEVQALKAEVEILKRSFEEEREARKTGDSLSGEAVLQLQTVLEFERKQRSMSQSKLEQHFEAIMNNEISNLKQTLESKISHQVSRDVSSSNDLRALRMELDREIKNRFGDLERRFEDSSHKFEELGRSIDQISRNTYESGMSDIMHGLHDERAERQMEDKAMHQLLTSLAEQTNIALEEETSRLWEALRTHNHDVMIGNADEGGKKCVQVQMANNGGFTQKSPRMIQVNQTGFTYVPSQGSAMMGNRAVTPPPLPTSHYGSPMASHRSSHRSLTPPATYSRQNLTNEISTHHQEVHQFVNHYSHPSRPYEPSMGFQFASPDQRQRIRIPAYQNGM